MKKVINWFEENYSISLIIILGIVVLIFTLSEFSDIGTPKQRSLGLTSITYHFFAFFFLNLFLLFYFVRGKTERKEFFIVAILISVFYGILDEVHQFYIPGRFLSFSDVMINNCGVFFSSVAYMIFNGKR